VRRWAPLRGYGQALTFAAGGSLLLMWSAATGASESALAGALFLIFAVWFLWEGQPSRRLIVSVTVTEHAISGFTDVGHEFTVPWAEVTAVTEIWREERGNSRRVWGGDVAALTDFWREERRAGRVLIGLKLTCPGRRPIRLYRFVMWDGPLPAGPHEEPGLSDFEELAAHIRAHTPRVVHRQGGLSRRSPR
jgi:hypothetical protein